MLVIETLEVLSENHRKPLKHISRKSYFSLEPLFQNVVEGLMLSRLQIQNNKHNNMQHNYRETKATKKKYKSSPNIKKQMQNTLTGTVTDI